MLSRKEIFEMYRVHCHYSGKVVPVVSSEDVYLEELRKMMQENPLAMNSYFHYKGFVSGVEALFAKIGGEVQDSEVSERLVNHYAEL